MKSILLALLLAVAASAADIQVFFSPNGGCTEAVVKGLEGATRTVLVQAYSFTSAPIAKALVDAHKRGVKVEMILDETQRTEKYSSADFVQRAGIPTFIDGKHAIAHNKVMVIDNLRHNAEMAKAIIAKTIPQIPAEPNWPCHSALKNAINDRKLWPKKTIADLKPLLEKYL